MTNGSFYASQTVNQTDINNQENHPVMAVAESNWDYINLLFLRPILAILFVFSLLVLGWYLAWKLVLVHVPLVQEIFGLRKKTFTPKPSSRRRLSKFYNSLDSPNSAGTSE